MPKRPISEEMLDAFVDRQLSREDRLRVRREVAEDCSLGRAVCDREQLKELVALAYPPADPKPGKRCGARFWWRWL